MDGTATPAGAGEPPAGSDVDRGLVALAGGGDGLGVMTYWAAFETAGRLGTDQSLTGSDISNNTEIQGETDPTESVPTNKAGD